MGYISFWHWLIIAIIIFTITFDWRQTYDWYLINRFIRRFDFHRRRVKCFASHFTFQKTMARKARDLDVDRLQWAFRLSDHRRKAKAVIKDEMLSRGITDDEIASWIPHKCDLTIPPPKYKPVGFSKYLYLMRQRRLAFIILRYFSFGLLAIFPIVIYLRYLDSQNLIRLFSYKTANDLIYTISYCLFFLAILLASVVVYCTRAHSLRILLLRPFGQRRLSAGLRSVVIREFGFYGNVFTLSDRNYRPSLILDGIGRLVDLSFIAIGPVFRRSPRGGRVKSERTFLNLARMLHKCFSPNFRSFVVGDQACNIKSHNQWWKLCIDLMINSSELIVMDVSHVGAGSEWEIAHLDRRGFVYDCIFIAQNGYETLGVEALARILEGRPVPKVFLYRSRGEFLELNEFNAELHRRLLKVVNGQRPG